MRNDAWQLGAHQAVVSIDESSVGPFHLVPAAVGGPQLIRVIHRLAPGATVVLYGNRGGGTDDFRLRDFFQAGAFNAHVIAFISTVPEEIRGEDLAILARLVADNRVRPQIGWTSDWMQTADALAAMARRAFPGKAVLTVSRSRPDPTRLPRPRTGSAGHEPSDNEEHDWSERRGSG